MRVNKLQKQTEEEQEGNNEAWRLLGLGVYGVGHVLVSDSYTTPTFMITLNYIIFLNYYRCCCVSVRVVSASVLRYE